MLKTVGFPSTRTGDQTIINGNIVIGTAGKGIDFSVDPSSPGMTSELLDDYEEGTWTPGQGSGLVVVGTFESSGTYTKIGNQVTVSARLAGSTSIACTAGGEFMTGLPYAPNPILVAGGTATNTNLAGTILFVGVPTYSISTMTGAGAIFMSSTYTV